MFISFTLHSFVWGFRYFTLSLHIFLAHSVSVHFRHRWAAPLQSFFLIVYTLWPALHCIGKKNTWACHIASALFAASYKLAPPNFRGSQCGTSSPIEEESGQGSLVCLQASSPATSGVEEWVISNVTIWCFSSFLKLANITYWSLNLKLKEMYFKCNIYRWTLMFQICMLKV